MSKPKLVAVIDAGTTNVKAAVVDKQLNIVEELLTPNQSVHPHPGWVEQSAEVIFQIVLGHLRQLHAKYHSQIKAVGITNQRESVLAWDARIGSSLYSLIVWQDSRTRIDCQRLAKQTGLAEYVRENTGLELSPYFSATKLSWLMKHVDRSRVMLGTLDSWLLYKLTGGVVHATDYTNASRTLLYNIRRHCWDKKLLNTFAIPKAVLPRVLPSRGHFGNLASEVLECGLPILAMAGDQQASLYGAGCQGGTLKVTYGTGIFPMGILGNKFELTEGLFTTLGVGCKGQPVYALEGKVEKAAARVSPVLHDKPRLNKVVEQLAAETETVLAPLLKQITAKSIVADGGISQNQHLLDTQAKLSGLSIKRQKHHNGTILGVAKLVHEQLGYNRD